jgi:multidrug resistance efflux pump
LGAKTTPIPTPLSIRWRRMQYQLLPLAAVVMCGVLAWRLWRQSPRLTIVGQVDAQTASVRAPTDGLLVELPRGRSLVLYDGVSAGQVVARLEHEGKSTDLIAGMSGQIVAVHHRPGHAVTAGEAILTIASDHGRSITTYVRAEQRLSPEAGMPVEIRLRSDISQSFAASVQRIGPQYEPVPPAQLRDRKSEEWGLPVVISIPPDVSLKPGELVYVGWPAATKEN